MRTEIYIIILIIILILIVLYSKFTKQVENMNSVTKNDNKIWTKQQWLDAHNKARREANANLPDLVWDDELAIDALNYATNGPTPDQYGTPSHPCLLGKGHSCKKATGSCLDTFPNYFCHSSDASRFKRGIQQGENVSWACPKDKYSDKTIMQELIDERKKYVYPQTPKEAPDAGHWTQIVNRNVTRVGCGCSNCGDGARMCICRYDYYQSGDRPPF